jgi:hypothetical protein
MSLKGAIWLAVAIFALTVLVRMPAGLMPLLLPAAIHCESPDGTLWQGSCAQLRSGGLELSDLQWTLHPASLLRLQIAADLHSTDPRATGQTRMILRRDGVLELEALQAQVPLQGGLQLLPQGWSGALDLALERASVQNGHLIALQGRITLRQLHIEQPTADLGNFELDVPAPPAAASGAPSPIVGQLHDLGGPLSVQGELRLSSDGAYELSSTLQPRSGASEALQQALRMLGPLDAQGRYGLSLAGTM